MTSDLMSRGLPLGRGGLAGLAGGSQSQLTSVPYNGVIRVVTSLAFSWVLRALNSASLPFKMSYGLFRSKSVTTTALAFPGDKSDILINKCRLEPKKSEIISYCSQVAVSCWMAWQWSGLHLRTVQLGVSIKSDVFIYLYCLDVPMNHVQQIQV